MSVDRSFVKKIPFKRLALNGRARISVLWALRYKFGEHRVWCAGDIAELTRHDLAVVPGCGPKTVAHVEAKLAELGLAFAEEHL